MMFLKFFKLLLAVICILEQFIFVISVAVSYNKDSVSHDSQNLGRYERQTKEDCQIPDNPLHTKYKVIGYNSAENETGSYVPKFSLLTTICDSGYNINPIGTNYSLCINSNWSPLPFDCKRTCPSLNPITSTNVTCRWDNIPLENCNNPVEETKALLSCNPFYMEVSLEKNPVRVCRSGMWTPSIPDCYPTCGLKSPVIWNYIGTPIPHKEYPWQVGIYNSQKKLICEGTIIDQRIILTVAHCVADSDGNVLPVQNFSVAAGKLYSEYNDARDNFAQYSNVFKIYIPDRYTGIQGLYEFDIAVIVLTDPFKLSARIRPICIELNEESENLNLLLNKSGIVTSWSNIQKEEEPSQELQKNSVQYIPYDKCYSEIPNQLRRYITNDKICGSQVNNGYNVKSECAGNHGAGLFFNDVLNDRYYLKAIASGPVRAEKITCDLKENNILIYTSITAHLSFIQNILLFNKMSESLESIE